MLIEFIFAEPALYWVDDLENTSNIKLLKSLDEYIKIPLHVLWNFTGNWNKVDTCGYIWTDPKEFRAFGEWRVKVTNKVCIEVEHLEEKIMKLASILLAVCKISDRGFEEDNCVCTEIHEILVAKLVRE